MSDIPQHILDDDAPQDTTKVVLERVAGMVAQQRSAKAAVEAAEAELKKANADLYRIESVDMPELLREAGLSEVVLEDGTKVKVVDEISCGVSVERRPEAWGWLRKRNFDGIIKTKVEVSFGKGEIDNADKLFVQLIEQYGQDNVAETETVHPSTLKSFIKERIAAAATDEAQKENVPPFDLFGVEPYALAKITLTKKKGAM